MEQNQTKKRFLIGLAILCTGMALLLSNLGILNYEIKRYLLRWEMVLMVLGTIFILSHDSKGPGILLLIIGGSIYLRDFFDLSFNFWQLFWPAILILAGIVVIFRHRVDHGPHCPRNRQLTEDSEDTIDEIAVFGGGEKNITSQNFRGGKILCLFGGSSIDLSRAKLAVGKNVIDIVAIFGGMKLVVPDNWKVRINAVSIFGGFSDKHRMHIPDNATNTDNELIIRGFVIFGGGEIKSF